MKKYTMNASNGSVVPLESNAGEWLKCGEVDYEMSTLRYEKEEALEQIAALEAALKEKEEMIHDLRQQYPAALKYCPIHRRIGVRMEEEVPCCTIERQKGQIAALTAENQKQAEKISELHWRLRDPYEAFLSDAAKRDNCRNCKNMRPATTLHEDRISCKYREGWPHWSTKCEHWEKKDAPEGEKKAALTEELRLSGLRGDSLDRQVEELMDEKDVLTAENERLRNKIDEIRRGISGRSFTEHKKYMPHADNIKEAKP